MRRLLPLVAVIVALPLMMPDSGFAADRPPANPAFALDPLPRSLQAVRGASAYLFERGS